MHVKYHAPHDLSFGGNETEWRARTRRYSANVVAVVIEFVVLVAAEKTLGGGKGGGRGAFTLQQQQVQRNPRITKTEQRQNKDSCGGLSVSQPQKTLYPDGAVRP